jgi:hypothetical protein
MTTGQLKTAKGYESDGLGGTPRLHEQFGYAYDTAWNLNYRTNNALLQTFAVNNLNELSTASRSGTLTVAGTVGQKTDPVSVTVSGFREGKSISSWQERDGQGTVPEVRGSRGR